jgi:hypothetical protein
MVEHDVYTLFRHRTRRCWREARGKPTHRERPGDLPLTAEIDPRRKFEFRTPLAVGTLAVSGTTGRPDGWQMRHASRFFFGIAQLAVQFRWRGPCAQLASRLG